MSERLDNLIPIHSARSKTELAGWEAPPPAENGLGMHLRADVRIPMADGTLLACDVYTPKQVGRYPVVLSFSSYNFDLATAATPTATNEIGSPDLFVPRGYVMVVVSARGVGRSGGELQLWLSEPLAADIEQCIAWAAEQEWSNGSVGMFGTSYFGMVQPLVAVRRPPALKCFFANEICTAYDRHVFRFAGNPAIDFLSLWSGANFTRSALRRHMPPIVRAALSWLLAHPHTFELVRPHMDKIMEGFKDHRHVHPSVLAWITAFVAGEEQLLPAPEGPSKQLGEIEIPFVVVQNRATVALHQFGSYDLFEHAGTPADKRWLIVGPAEYELPVREFELEALAFFDHVLKGANNGYDQQAHVRYFRDGTEDWARAENFPAGDSVPLVLYPAADHALVGAAPGGGEASWLALPRGMAVLPEVAETTPERVTFGWTAPRALEMFGPVTLALKLSSNEIDAFVAARLDRVTVDGTRTPLGFGFLRAAARTEQRGSVAEIAHDPRSRVPLVPFEPVTLRLSITPISAMLAAGDRVELVLASRMEQVRASVAEGFIMPDSPVPFFARVKIHCGLDTRIEITTRP